MKKNNTLENIRKEITPDIRKKVEDNVTDFLNKVCPHKRTYVAVRHVSGIRLIKCSDCGCVVN